MIDKVSPYAPEGQQSGLEALLTDARRAAQAGAVGSQPDRPAGLITQSLPGGAVIRTTPSASPLSVAIDGPGLFVSQSANALNFGRLGDFRFDEAGALRDGAGRAVLGYRVDAAGNPIGALVPLSLRPGDGSATSPDAFAIDERGVISAHPDKAVRVEDRRAGRQAFDSPPIGRLALAVFPAPERLARVDATALRQTKASGKAVLTVAGAPNAGTLRSHALEHGLVDLEHDLAAMWRLSRRADAQAAIAGAADECARTALGLVK